MGVFGHEAAKIGINREEAGGRWEGADGRRQEADGRWEEADGRRQEE